jgi:hypothetical protein
MSNDIAARLRDIEGGYGFRAICREAADEIERLRRELGQVSDADSWVSKADAAHLDSLLNWCEFNDMESHRALQRLVNDRARLRGEVTRLRAGGCARGQTTTQFCAEAEQLRSERDEARRRVCTDSLQLGQVYRRVGGQSVRVTTPEAVAEMMGWRCFEDIAARCGDGGAGAHTAGPTETFIPEAL